MSKKAQAAFGAPLLVPFLILLALLYGCAPDGGSVDSRVPEDPSGLTATAHSTSSIFLSWIDKSDNELGFIIQRSLSPGGGFAQVKAVGANETNWLDTSLSSAMACCYRVLAFNGAGSSGFSNEASATTPSGGSAPVISLSATDLSFSAVQGGANPAGKTVSVTNSGGGTLSGLSIGISYTSGSGWLTGSLNSITAPATLTTAASTGSLAAGTYNATVSVSSAAATNSPQTVSVSFTVSEPSPSPAISLSASGLSFSAVQGGANPAGKTVSVTNSGGGTLSGLSIGITYTSGSGWLTGSLNSITAPATLTAAASTGSLAAGTYNATVSVSSAAATNSPQTVSVSFTVSAPVTYTLTTTASPAGGGSVTRDPNASSYSAGAVVSLTATANPGYTFTGWSGDASGSTNPTNVTTSSSKSVTASFAKVAVLSGPSSATGPFQLTWTFAWPPLGGTTDDHYELEYSYSPTSSFAVLAVYANGVRTTPYTDTILPDAADVGKTAYFRVRVRSIGNWTPYSNVVGVSVPYLNLTFHPDCDNGLLNNSADASFGNTVYTNGNVVGTNYSYDMNGSLTGTMVAATAFRFDINTFIAGRTINRATLILWPSNLPGDFTGTYAVNALAANWSGSTITFNMCPGYHSPSVSIEAAPVTTAVSWNFDVTTIVQAWANGTWNNYGLLLRDYAISPPGHVCIRSVGINSLENAQSLWPTLYVEVR